MLSAWTNPVKIWVLTADWLNKLDKMYPNLLIAETVQKAWTLCNLFIDDTNSIDEVDMMLKDRWYNGLKVIDVIGYSKIDQLMENKKVWIFITNIWIGPYERSYVTSMSTNHEILFTMNKNTKFTLYNYVSDKSNQLLKWLKHPKKKISNLFKERNKNVKAHIFQFENWKRSIDSLYFVDWICIIAIAIIFQVLLYRVLSNSLTLQNNLKTMQTIRTQIASLQQSSTNQSQLASYQSQILQLDQDTLDLMDYAYTNYDLFCNYFNTIWISH